MKRICWGLQACLCRVVSLSRRLSIARLLVWTNLCSLRSHLHYDGHPLRGECIPDWPFSTKFLLYHSSTSYSNSVSNEEVCKFIYTLQHPIQILFHMKKCVSLFITFFLSLIFTSLYVYIDVVLESSVIGVCKYAPLLLYLTSYISFLFIKPGYTY